MIWEQLSTADFEAVDRRCVAVLPIAAIEQHGAHLPVSVDADIGMHFLNEAERRMPADIIVLPQIKMACSDHHMDFAGTLSVSAEAFLAYASDILESVIAHGFSNLVVFNSHGGNQAIGRVLTDRIGLGHPACRVVMATWWNLAADALGRIRRSPPGGANHAGELETAVMLFAHPDRVRREAIAGRSNAPTMAWAEEDMLRPPRAFFFRTMHEKSGGTGVVGEPALATSDTGAKVTDAVVEALCTIVADLRADPAAAGDQRRP